jgi:putative ATP-dependent endonuclease of OLD family
VIFVEGDAEEALIPVFAATMGLRLDQLGITVCNVAGTNFRPYVKLATALNISFAIVTDWDPLDGTSPPLGRKRTLDIWEAMSQASGQPPADPALRAQWDTLDYAAFGPFAANYGVFLNDRTFEVSVAATPALLQPLLDILDEQGFGSRRSKRIRDWRSGTPVDPTQLLAMIADIGKGRLSARLAKRAGGLQPPQYIADAISWVTSRVQ